MAVSSQTELNYFIKKVLRLKSKNLQVKSCQRVQLIFLDRVAGLDLTLGLPGIGRPVVKDPDLNLGIVQSGLQLVGVDVFDDGLGVDVDIDVVVDGLGNDARNDEEDAEQRFHHLGLGAVYIKVIK